MITSLPLGCFSRSSTRSGVLLFYEGPETLAFHTIATLERALTSLSETPSRVEGATKKRSLKISEKWWKCLYRLRTDLASSWKRPVTSVF